MVFIHIVSFSCSTDEQVKDLTQGLLALKDTVRNPQGGQCIRSLKGGKQVSKEGHDKGMKVVFVMEFETDEDLQWYLWRDASHTEFKNNTKSRYGVDGVTVLDFEDGSY